MNYSKLISIQPLSGRIETLFDLSSDVFTIRIIRPQKTGLYCADIGRYAHKEGLPTHASAMFGQFRRVFVTEMHVIFDQNIVRYLTAYIMPIKIDIKLIRILNIKAMIY